MKGKDVYRKTQTITSNETRTVVSGPGFPRTITSKRDPKRVTGKAGHISFPNSAFASQHYESDSQQFKNQGRKGEASLLFLFLELERDPNSQGFGFCDNLFIFAMDSNLIYLLLLFFVAQSHRPILGELASVSAVHARFRFSIAVFKYTIRLVNWFSVFQEENFITRQNFLDCRR